MSTIILTGGGSAGHCTPNVALIPYLKKHFSNIYYIGSINGIERKIIEKENIKYFAIHTAKLQRKICLSNLTIPINLIKGIKESKEIIKKISPDIVFAKGGFVSVPVVIGANKLKVPVICHESDYSLGLANKISLKFCDKMITSFPDTLKLNPKIEYIGAPLRKELFLSTNNSETFGFFDNKPILLVFGGSLGAKAINDVVRNSLYYLLKDFNIIHICGKNNIKEELKNVKGYFQTEYIFDMGNAINASSIVVARAGSNSLFELLALKKPSVIIPLPKGISRGDQEQNALYFQKKGLITVLPQSALTSSALINAIKSTYKNRFNLEKNFLLSPVTNKSEKIANVIYEFSHK